MIHCACGKTFDTAPDFFRHRDSATCPKNAPSSSRAFPTWAKGAGKEILHAPKTPAEAERRERDRARMEEVKSNPEYQANALRKREEAKELRRRMAERRAAFTTPARKATTEEDDVKKKAKKKAARKAPKKLPATKTDKAIAKALVGAAWEIPKGLTLGQVLERQYKGKTIRVQVNSNGLRFNGKDYRTLGSIADEVVGRHVSGPAFFGLWTAPGEKKTRRKAASPATS